MTPLLAPPTLSVLFPSHLLWTCRVLLCPAHHSDRPHVLTGEKRQMENKCGLFTIKDPTRPPNSSPSRSCQYPSDRSDRRAEATATATEINGIWQETLLFFQSRVLPSKHRDLDENGRSRQLCFRGTRCSHTEHRPSAWVRDISTR